MASISNALPGLSVRYDEAALESLWSGLYPDLKQMARARLRRSGQHTLLDTTGLVNDAYVRVAGAAALKEASPGQFLAYASRAMRSVVIDLVRERHALRHGGDLARITLNTAAHLRYARRLGDVPVAGGGCRLLAFKRDGELTRGSLE